MYFWFEIPNLNFERTLLALAHIQYSCNPICTEMWKFTQGSSARLVFPAILEFGQTKGWGEIQNLYMRFVILKVKNRSSVLFQGGPLYVIVCSPGSWDWPTWLNKPWVYLWPDCINPDGVVPSNFGPNLT